MSQPNNSVTEEDVQLVKEIIYRLENIWIQRKHFLDQGRPNFITNTDIQKEIQNESSLSEAQVTSIVRNLSRDEFIVFDDVLSLIVRSRTFHTIWCIFKTEYRDREPNVGDFKYVRHIKQIPVRNHRLTEIYTENKDVAKILGGPKQLIHNIIRHIENYPV